ncbi:ABC transporter substrate-binding protein [Pseudonocardia sp. ICBG601]|uniref:ABC transporter substrate-binding protein n=1 Tax=Pseudonocardia sp. ICBG601 TaxID=2846759 RepID=UPI001CF66EFF|nr:ABC transporter substrate-binding protein [Pseudonocardia sp. ICBG601]
MPAPATSRRRLLAGGLGLALLAACGRPAPGDTDGAPAAGGFPRTVRHEAGETTVPAAPERVVALSDYLDLDLVLALGVRPVLYGFTDAWGSGNLPWQTEAGVAGLTRMDIPTSQAEPERVVAARPDLLVGMPPAGEQYDVLSRIAPTVCLGWETTWHDGLATVAAALGREDRVEGLAQRYRDTVTTAAARLRGLGGLPVVVGSTYHGQVYVQGDASPMVGLLRDLGLRVHTTGPDAVTEYSPEQVDVLRPAGVLLCPATDAAGTAAAEASELWRRLPAVAAGRYSVLSPVLARGLTENLSPLSVDWALRTLVPLLERTAAGDGVPLGRAGS